VLHTVAEKPFKYRSRLAERSRVTIRLTVLTEADAEVHQVRRPRNVIKACADRVLTGGHRPVEGSAVTGDTERGGRDRRKQ